MSDLVGPNLRRLLEIGGAELAGHASVSTEDWGLCGAQLAALLDSRNGFFAFESALLVRPTVRAGPVASLGEWNAPHAWIADYGGLADGALYFAEDVFGAQFCISADGVSSFDPETGQREVLAPDLEAWAGLILADFEYLTGWPLAHTWQERHGALDPGTRLYPAIPFVLGGAFEIENLRAMASLDSMRARASIALQIKGLPDGTTVELKVIP